MKSKTQPSAIGISLSILSMLIFSCKKESTSSIMTAENNSIPAEVVAKQNLAAWYKFTNGNTADYSGNNNHLKAHNVTLAADYQGRPNNAFFFDGNNSFLNAANSASLNPSKITLVALFKPTSFYTGAGSTSRIFMKGDDDQSNGDYFLGFYNTGSSYGTYGDNQFQSNGVSDPNNSIQLNNWYKLIYTYDGSVGKLYVNDVLVNQNTKVATFNPNASPLRVGKTGRTDFPYWFIGVIDEIRIYNIALTASQVSKVDLELGQ